MKQLFTFATSMLMSIIATVNAVAQTAYARFDESEATLTFFFDDNQQQGDYTMNQGTQTPVWLSFRDEVKKVRFDSSFAKYRPVSTYAWFMGMYNLETVQMLKNLNTEDVTTMSHMFDGCAKLGNGKYELSLAGWNTSKVTDMSYMFNGCKSVTGIDVTWFDTRNVTTMAYMFAGCSSYLQELNLTNFNTANVTDMSGMFKGDTYLRRVYIITNNWKMDKVTKSTDMFAGAKSIAGADGTTYSEQFTDKTYARVDGNNLLPGYFLYTPGYVVYDENCSLTFYCDGKRKEHEDNGETVYDLNTGNNKPAWQEDMVMGVFFDESFIDCRPASCHEWFKDMSDIEFVDGIELLNTSRATSMAGMFSGCAALTEINVSNFITDKVVDMSGMFNDCANVAELDIKGFRTGSVKSFKGMFQGCASLTDIDIRHFIVNPDGLYGYYFSTPSFVNDENTNDLFAGCENLQTLRLPNSFSGIKAGMFKGCGSISDIYYGGMGVFYVTDERNLTDAGYCFLPNKKTRIHLGTNVCLANDSYDYNFTIVKNNDMEYEINSEADWAMLVKETTRGNKMNVKLMADITVKESPCTFVGTFDGNGHTITLADSDKKLQTWSEWAKERKFGKVIGMPTINPKNEEKVMKEGVFEKRALFCELKNATVKNLKVNGEMRVGKHGAALAACVNGNTTISNCLVSTKLIFCGEPNLKNNNYSDNGYVGGIVGHAGNSNLTIEGCLFNGEICKDEIFEGKMKYVGTFVGWCEDSKNIKVVNCMEMGTYDTKNIQHCGLNYDKSCNAKAVKTTNTYHCQNWGEGIHGYKINVDNSLIVNYLDSIAAYNVSGIVAYNNGLKVNGKRYAGNGQTVKMHINSNSCRRMEDYGSKWVKVSSGTIDKTGNAWTLKMAASDCDVTEDLFAGFNDYKMGGIMAAKSAGAFETQEEATDVETLKEEQANESKCYDVSGRLMNNKPQRGIYIMNGKRYVK